MALPIALIKTSSATGLVKNSTAPAFMALTVIGTSACPVIKMIGMSIRSPAINDCSSRPLRPGKVTSNTRQLGTEARGKLRKPWAGFEDLRSPSSLNNQRFQCLSHRWIIIHDEHDRCRRKHRK